MIPPKVYHLASGLAVLVIAHLSQISSVDAVVIASGDGSGNTTAPTPASEDPGFDNVGAMGSGTAVYLGNRWILTAAHLSTAGGTATFGGTSYGFVSGTDTRLSNPAGSGLTGLVDLRMIRLDGDPGLPSVTIASAAPTSSTGVVMIGRGPNRQASNFFWDVDTVPDPDVWTLVTPPPPADAEGFQTAAGNTIRWGQNEIANPSFVVNAGFGDTQSFSTVFDAAGMTHEAQASTGDSGGGVFAMNGGSWELIGIMHTVSLFDGQPPAAIVYGTATNAADLAFYRDEINALVATPEPSTTLLGLAAFGLFLRRRR